MAKGRNFDSNFILDPEVVNDIRINPMEIIKYYEGEFNKDVNVDINLTKDHYASSDIMVIATRVSKFQVFLSKEREVLGRLEERYDKLLKRSFRHALENDSYDISATAIFTMIKGNDDIGHLTRMIKNQEIVIDYLKKAVDRMDKLSLDLKNHMDWVKFMKGDM